ncbi:MAG: hypothetical protein ABL878_08285, partial [Burkholderiales bacterium]
MTSWLDTISRDPRTWLRFVPAVFAVGMIAFATLEGGHFDSIASFALIYAVFVTGLNIFMGLGGQASFGQNAFAAISGYTSAVLTTTYGWGVLPAMTVGIASAVVC